jgi:hypothetical protein
LAIAVLVVALLAVPAVNALGASVGVDVGADAEAWLTPRGSIVIDREVGPTGFVLGHDPVTGEPIHNTAMGVRGGSGTAEDPYLISNWTIHHSAPYAIEIAGTDAHVVLEDIVIPTPDHSGPSSDGVTTGI